MTTPTSTTALANRRPGVTPAVERQSWIRSHPYTTGLAAVAGILAASALVNHQLARRAEQRNPPSGRFITVDGVLLHYTEQGEGMPLVLLHGNGSMIEDFASSGLIDLAARRYRVIVRPSWVRAQHAAATYCLERRSPGRSDPFCAGADRRHPGDCAGAFLGGIGCGSTGARASASIGQPRSCLWLLLSVAQGRCGDHVGSSGAPAG